MKVRTKVFVTALIGVAGALVLFFEPIYSAYCSITKTSRNWIADASPMREPVKNIWGKCKRGDVSISTDQEKLAAIVQMELPAGSSDAEVRAHISKHYVKPNFVSTGVQPATQYRQEVYGYSSWDDRWILVVRYFTRNEKFLFADMCMERPKGCAEKRFHLTPKVDLWPSALPPE